MSVPAINGFKHESNWNRWVADAPSGAFDLAVPDDNGTPHELAIALLQSALPDVERLLERAQRYVSEFCAPASSGPAGEPSLVEVSVASRRGGLKVYLSINYDEDRYGLWSVGFSHSEHSGWTPVSFSREAW